MPIGRDEWDKGRKADTPEARIENFLGKNRGNAFTLSEIATNVFGMRTAQSMKDFLGNVLSYWTVEEAIKTLLHEGRIQAKSVKQRYGTNTYYAIP